MPQSQALSRGKVKVTNFSKDFFFILEEFSLGTFACILLVRTLSHCHPPLQESLGILYLNSSLCSLEKQGISGWNRYWVSLWFVIWHLIEIYWSTICSGYIPASALTPCLFFFTLPAFFPGSGRVGVVCWGEGMVLGKHTSTLSRISVPLPLIPRGLLSLQVRKIRYLLCSLLLFPDNCAFSTT